MKLFVLFAVLIIGVSAGLDDVFSSLKQDVQKELYAKVTRAFTAVAGVIDELKELEKTFPESLHTLKGKLDDFEKNSESLVSEAKLLYEDEQKGKTLSVALELMKATSEFTKVTTEVKSLKPLFKLMVAKHVKEAQTALDDLKTLTNKLTNVVKKRSLTDEATTMLSKVRRGYLMIQSSYAEILKLLQKYPNVYEDVKTELPDLESSLKSLLTDMLAVTDDKKKDKTLKLMWDVAKTGDKLSHVVSVINKLKPELKDVLHETTGDANETTQEIKTILNEISPSRNTRSIGLDELVKLMETVIGEQKSKHLQQVLGLLEDLVLYVREAKSEYPDVKQFVLDRLLQLENNVKNIVSDLKQIYEDATHENYSEMQESFNKLDKDLDVLHQELAFLLKNAPEQFKSLLQQVEVVLTSLSI